VRSLFRILILIPIQACGLDPLYEETGGDLEKSGVDIKETSYGVELRDIDVAFPPVLQQLFQSATARRLLMGVPEQGVSTFRTFAAASNPLGDQDLCATTTELALATWSSPDEFVIDGGRFFLPISGQSVRFNSTYLEGSITEDGDWSPLAMNALVDSRELSGFLADGTDPCANKGACIPCDDGLRLCLEIEMRTHAIQLETDFDPQPDCEGS
jgi:hypothetical protein